MQLKKRHIRYIKNLVFLKPSYTGFKKHHKDMNPLELIWNAMDNVRARFIILAISLSFIETLWASVGPNFVKNLTNNLHNFNGNINDIWNVVSITIIFMMIFWFTTSTIFCLVNWINAKYIRPTFEAQIKISFTDRIIKNSYEYFMSSQLGKTTSTMLAILQNAMTFVEVCIYHFLPNIFASLTIIINFFFVHWSLSLLVGIHWISLIFFNFIYLKKINICAKKSLQAFNKTLSQIADMFLNISSIFLYNRQKDEFNRLKTFQNSESRKRSKFLCKQQELTIITNITVFIMWSFYMYIQIELYRNGKSTVGDVVFSITALNMYVYFIFFLQMDGLILMETFGTLKEGVRQMQEGNMATKSRTGQMLQIKEGKIEFRNIKFGYNNENNLLFNNENLLIKPKTKIGIVGKSGNGKTTLLNLLLGNLQLFSGMILIDDQNISEISEDSLKNSITVISQNTTLFNRTIIDNIQYGKISASFDEIVEAATLANIHDFIVNLPNGYYTNVGERGDNLSGGQRQRIIIARAILKNSPILLLDEATSALDIESEEIVQNSLENLMSNRTVITISHKLSTLDNMDEIVVIKNGKFIEQGTIENLMNNSDSEYYKFYTQYSNKYLT